MRPLVTRLRRSWLRVGLMTAAGAGVVVLASAVLLHEPIEPSRRGPVRTAGAAPVATATASPTPSTAVASPPRVVPMPAPRRKPTSPKELFAQDAQVTPAELAAWTSDESIDPQVRYCALRRLEQADPTSAVTAALELLDEVTPLLRLNAIALLTRSPDPRAKEALGKLDERSLLLAHALARGRRS